MSWRAPGVPKPTAGGLDTPNVSPAEALRPGLLKLKPEVLLLPKPGLDGERERQRGRDGHRETGFRMDTEDNTPLLTHNIYARARARARENSSLLSMIGY